MKRITYDRFWVFTHYEFWLTRKIYDAIFIWEFFDDKKISKRIRRILKGISK